MARPTRSGLPGAPASACAPASPSASGDPRPRPRARASARGRRHGRPEYQKRLAPVATDNSGGWLRFCNRDCRADGSGFATDKSGGWLRRVAGFHSSEDWQIRRTPRAEGPGKFAHGAGNSADDSGGWLLQVSGPGPGIEVDVSGGWLRQDSGCVTMRCVKDPAQHNETRATTDDWKQCLAIANEGGFERMVWMSGVGVGAGGPTWKAKA